MGVDGQRRPLYQPTRRYELEWGIMSTLQFNQLCDFYEEISVTGTITVVPPRWCGDSWTGTVYTALLEEPVSDSYWEKHHLRVRLGIVKVVAV